MTRDDIIRMAREAGFSEWAVGLSEMPMHLERFAALVAAAERETCAMECIKLANKWTRLGAWGENNEFYDCAAAIRARGQA